MSGRPIFDSFSGPAGLVDRMIGEEYEVVKLVADKIPDLDSILVAIQAIQDFDDLMTSLNTAVTDSAASALAASSSAATALSHKNSADTFRGQAAASAAAAAVSDASALTSKNAAAGSATSANNSAVSAGSSQSAAAISATTANKWATQTSAEVVVGQGYGAKKYALDAEDSAIEAAGSATASEISRLAAVTAKNEAVEIAGFDVSLYAQKTYARQLAKRAAYVFGS